jgi:hypothetical protein
VDAELGADHAVAEAGAHLAAVVEVAVAAVDLDVVDVFGDDPEVEQRAGGELGLRDVGGVGAGEVAGVEVGAGPQPRQRDARGVVGEAAAGARALNNSPEALSRSM